MHAAVQMKSISHHFTASLITSSRCARHNAGAATTLFSLPGRDARVSVSERVSVRVSA